MDWWLFVSVLKLETTLEPGPRTLFSKEGKTRWNILLLKSMILWKLYQNQAILADFPFIATSLHWISFFYKSAWHNQQWGEKGSKTLAVSLAVKIPFFTSSLSNEMKKTGNAMIIPEETFSQSKMKYPITSLIVYQLIFYTCENQNEKHFTKMQRKLVLYQFKTTVLSSTKGTASSPFFPPTPICSSGRNRSSRALMINNSLAGGSRETLNGVWSQVNLKCTIIEYWSCFIGRRGISF